MFEWLDWNLVQSVLRHGLTALGGLLVGLGYISADMVPELVGAALTILGVVFSAFSAKTKTKAQKVEKAVDQSVAIEAVKSPATGNTIIVGTGSLAALPEGKKV